MNRINRKKIITGVVVSDKMSKTIVVQSTRRLKHRTYNKIVTQHARYKAHDEKNDAKIGNTVLIQETRPISKDKRWRLIKILDATTTNDQLNSGVIEQ